MVFKIYIIFTNNVNKLIEAFMRKISITQTVHENTVTMSAHDQNQNLISIHAACIDNDDLVGAALLALIRVMRDISAGNNIKLINFDATMLNMLMYDYRRWRRSGWLLPGADVRHMKLWEMWHVVKKYNKIYPQYI